MHDTSPGGRAHLQFNVRCRWWAEICVAAAAFLFLSFTLTSRWMDRSMAGSGCSFVSHFGANVSEKNSPSLMPSETWFFFAHTSQAQHILQTFTMASVDTFAESSSSCYKRIHVFHVPCIFGCTRNCFAFLIMTFSELPRLYPVSRNVVNFFHTFSVALSLSIVVHNQTTGRLTSDYSLHRIYMNWPFSCQASALMKEKCHFSINAAQLKYFHLALVDEMKLK